MSLVHHDATLQVFAAGPRRSQLVWITDFLPHELKAEVRVRTQREDPKRALEEPVES